MPATRSDTPVLVGDLRVRRGRGGLRTVVAVAVACVAFVVIDAFVGDRGLAALVRARQEHARLAAEVDAKRLENARLRAQIKRLRGEDPTAIEEIARRDLGLIKPGERLFIIRDVPPPGPQ